MSNFGSDIVMLSASDLSVKRRLDVKKLAEEPTFKIVSTALSVNGNFLAAMYFQRAATQSAAGQTVGRVRFRLYDLNSLAVTTDCVLADRATYPSFRIALAPGGETFLASLPDEHELGEYDSRTCSLKHSWTFADVPARGDFSPDGTYIAVVFDGTHPKSKLAVLSRGVGKTLWSLPAKSANKMEWPVSIHQIVAFWRSVPTGTESPLDTLGETSHVNEPGVEILDLSTGHRVARAVFMRRTRSISGFATGTTLVQFLSDGEIATVAPGPNVRFYSLSENDEPTR